MLTSLLYGVGAEKRWGFFILNILTIRGVVIAISPFQSTFAGLDRVDEWAPA